MEVYETEDDYSMVQINQIISWFNGNIGTDYEFNPSASGLIDQYYIMFFDLTHKEVDKIGIFELKFREAHNE